MDRAGQKIAFVVLLVFAWLGPGPAWAQFSINSAPPTKNTVKIISVDFCADQYVLAVAPPAHIAGLSDQSTSAYAAGRKKAQEFTSYRPRAEILLAQKPTLIVRQWGGDARMLNLLKRHGADSLQLGYVTDFDGIIANLAKIGTATSQETVAGQITENLRAQLHTLKRDGADLRSLSALYVTPGGVTAGQGTMIDAIFTAAGLTNSAGDLAGWPALPAEALVREPPDVIVTGFFDGPLERSNNWSAARHPVFQKMFARVPTIHLPPDLISCAGPASIKAVRMLQSEARVHLEKQKIKSNPYHD